MSAKKNTPKEIGETFGYIVEHMATKEDTSEIKKTTATKADIAAIMEEFADIKRRLKDVEAAVEDHSGRSTEIDHALERVGAIEKHLGLVKKIAA